MSTLVRQQTLSANRVLSLIQPTAELHIGNFFGAVANWVHLQNKYCGIYGIADLHAMTMPYDPPRLRENTDRMMLDLIACGLDPEKAIVFVQSQVPEHTELCWILGCLCSYGDLTRMTQFKEKAEQVQAQDSTKIISVGLFTYPVLQAADILIYRAQYVPVGLDQEQHLELSRKVARRFNQGFGVLFPEPEPLFSESPKIMSLADPDRKMSKSLGARHYIGLFEDAQSIRSKVRAAVTDCGILPTETELSPGVANLVQILKACGKQVEASAFLQEYQAGRRQYSELKEAVAAALVELTTGLRAKREEVRSNAAKVKAQIREMAEMARKIAGETLREVRARVGLPERT